MVQIPPREVCSAAIALCLLAAPAVAQTSAESGSSSPTGRVKVDFGLEYWVNTSYRTNFDFDRRLPDGDGYVWQRVKPRMNVIGRRFEFVFQGQDSRPYGIPATASSKSQLDLLKAHVKINGPSGLLFKIGREQGEGEEVGISRRMLSSTNYGIVLKAFDLAAVEAGTSALRFLGWMAMPVDNRPTQFNKIRKGELFWGVQATSRRPDRTLRTYVATRSVNRPILVAETGARGEGAVHDLGIQHSGALLVPGISWDLEGIYQWGRHSTDAISAWALYVNGTYTVAPRRRLTVGYHQTSGDRVRGDGRITTYDPLYASGFNEFGYMGLSAGRNTRHLRVIADIRLIGPFSLYWNYHDSYLQESSDRWYSSIAPQILRSGARSSHFGQEIDTAITIRTRLPGDMTLSLGHLVFFPGAYLRSTGPHTTAHQFTIDLFGAF